MTLSSKDIRIGSRLRVLSYRNQSPYAQHLQYMGLVPGTEVEVIRRAPLGDPIELRLRGFSLALRPAEADDLEVQLLS